MRKRNIGQVSTMKSFPFKIIGVDSAHLLDPVSTFVPAVSDGIKILFISFYVIFIPKVLQI